MSTLRRSIWGSGQDQCATIKRQLLAYVPGLAVFLDGMVHTNLNAIGQHTSSLLTLWARCRCTVDDLDDIGELESYIEQTAVMLIFVSKVRHVES